MEWFRDDGNGFECGLLKNRLQRNIIRLDAGIHQHDENGEGRGFLILIDGPRYESVRVCGL